MYLFCCLIPIFVPKVDINFLMNVGGSICSFCFVYLVPIAMHLQCYHYDNDFAAYVRRKLSNMNIIDRESVMHHQSHGEEGESEEYNMKTEV